MLGAGASCDYRLPTGEQLRRSIIDRMLRDASEREWAEKVSECESGLAFEMATKLNVAPTETIDAWLEKQIGKKASVPSSQRLMIARASSTLSIRAKHRRR